MSDCCDLKCEREFSKINESHFQFLGVIKIAKPSSNLAIYFRMRFKILVHCDLEENKQNAFSTKLEENQKNLYLSLREQKKLNSQKE